MDSRFKTMRHIETLRNYLNLFIKEIMNRGEKHDQSKLEQPELEAYDVITKKLRGTTYGSPEYKDSLRQMKPAIKFHYRYNRHHPEYFENEIEGMNLIDLMEMLCDWKASGLRHNDGDLIKSIEINRERFKICDQLYHILCNTAEFINSNVVYHKGEES